MILYLSLKAYIFFNLTDDPFVVKYLDFLNWLLTGLAHLLGFAELGSLTGSVMVTDPYTLKLVALLKWWVEFLWKWVGTSCYIC